MSTKKDRVYEAATRLVRQWNQMVSLHLPVRADNLPGSASILAAVAGPLDELCTLIGRGDEEAEHQAWEYRHVEKPAAAMRPPTDVLDKLGAEGWELCAADTIYLIFKRAR